MAEITGIAWTDSTFNPWIGCTKVGPGCDHCYAEALDKRHRWKGATHWGAGVERMRTAPSNWRKPLTWQKHALNGLLPDGKTPHGGRSPRVFCASLADVFDNEVLQAWRDDLWALVRSTPSLSWQILTKRIGNAADMLPAEVLPNLWLGATVVNQQEADRDLPKLKATPAAVRFVSYEPALDNVRFGDHLIVRKIHQIIVGGESTQGAAARPFNVHWARNTRRQCQVHGVAFFMKQFGANPVFHEAPFYEPKRIQLKDRAGAEPAEWPEDLRVQEFPA